MRAVVQRVSQASVTVGGEVVGSVADGLLVLVGVAPSDTPADARAVAAKLAGLRIFRDDAGKMNRCVLEIGGGALVISQFTLYADTRRGRRPSFVGAAPPGIAEPLVAALIEALEAEGVPCASGTFGADMAVSLTNDGPVTIVVETAAGKVL